MKMGAKRLWCKRLLEYSCLVHEKRRDSTFGLFWLWEETGYVWDVVAAAKRLWCKRLLEYSCLVQVLGMTFFGL